MGNYETKFREALTGSLPLKPEQGYWTAAELYALRRVTSEMVQQIAVNLTSPKGDVGSLVEESVC